MMRCTVENICKKPITRLLYLGRVFAIYNISYIQVEWPEMRYQTTFPSSFLSIIRKSSDQVIKLDVILTVMSG